MSLIWQRRDDEERRNQDEPWWVADYTEGTKPIDDKEGPGWWPILLAVATLCMLMLMPEDQSNSSPMRWNPWADHPTPPPVVESVETGEPFNVTIGESMARTEVSDKAERVYTLPDANYILPDVVAIGQDAGIMTIRTTNNTWIGPPDSPLAPPDGPCPEGQIWLHTMKDGWRCVDRSELE